MEEVTYLWCSQCGQKITDNIIEHWEGEHEQQNKVDNSDN